METTGKGISGAGRVRIAEQYRDNVRLHGTEQITLYEWHPGCEVGAEGFERSEPAENSWKESHRVGTGAWISLLKLTDGVQLRRAICRFQKTHFGSSVEN